MANLTELSKVPLSSYRAKTPAENAQYLLRFVGPRAKKWADRSFRKKFLTQQQNQLQKSSSVSKPTKTAFTSGLQPASQALYDNPLTFLYQSSLAATGAQIPTDSQQFFTYTAPEAYWRINPLLSATQDPRRIQGLLLPQAQAQQLLEEYLSKGGLRETDSYFSADRWKQILSPYRFVFDPQRVSELYQQALGSSYEQLLQAGYSPAEAKRYAEMSIGSLDDFRRQLAYQALAENKVGRINIDDIANFFMFGGFFPFVGLKGLSALGSHISRAADDQQSAQIFEDAIQEKIRRDALAGRYGIGLLDMAKGLFYDLPFGYYDPAAVTFGAGLQKFLTRGYAHTQQLSEAEIKNQLAKLRSFANRLQEGIPASILPTAEARDRMLEAISSLRSLSDTASRQRFAEAAAAATVPYVNWSEFDFGGNSAIESASSKLERLMPFGRGFGWQWHALRDILTDSNRSHEYLMAQAAKRTDNPYETYGRFRPYAEAYQLFTSGRWNPIVDDPSALRVADPGQQLHLLDPRRWLFGLQRKGEIAGIDPIKAREIFDAHWGKLLDEGRLSQAQVRQMQQNLSKNPALARVLDIEGRINTKWAPNYYRSSLASMSDVSQQVAEREHRLFGAPVFRYRQRDSEPTFFGSVSGPNTSKTGNANNGEQMSEGHQKTASASPLRKLRHFVKSAFSSQIASPASLSEWYAMQNLLRKKYFQEFMEGMLTGTGMTAEEWKYGRGFADRWSRFNHGRYSENIRGLFGGIIPRREKLLYDPILGAERERVLQGRWAPGVRLDQLIVSPTFGFTNPLGPLGTYFGIAKPEYAYIRDLHKGLTQSRKFQNLLESYRKGLIPEKDFAYLTRGSNPAQWSREFWESIPSAYVNQVSMGVERFKELARTIQDQTRPTPSYLR